MATAITTLICVAFLIVGVGALTQGSFKSVDVLSEAWDQMEETSEEIAGTKLEFTLTSHTSPVADVTLKNTGSEMIKDFDAWDLWVQFYTTTGLYNVRRLSYTTAASPGSNQWTVLGVYSNAGSALGEVTNPNVLDPGEEAIIRFRLNPAARSSPKNQVAVATPNGVSVSTLF